MRLSILICALERRQEIRQALIASLTRQSRELPVEILLKEDNGQMTIGQKRQWLLEQAKGDYISFVDDDDCVSHIYVSLILGALAQHPEATHCSLNGILVQVGKPERRFEHSTKYKEWATVNGIYVRPPNHLNTVRRALALQAGFSNKNWGEDKEYSERLVQLGTLTREAVIEPVLYVYQYVPHLPHTQPKRPAIRQAPKPV